MTIEKIFLNLIAAALTAVLITVSAKAFAAIQDTSEEDRGEQAGGGLLRLLWA
jgi:hypothetical protein